MTENNNKKKSSNNRRRNNKRHRNTGNSGNKESSPKNSNNRQRPGDQERRTNSANRRRNYNNRRRRPQRKLSPEEQFLRKYESFRKRHDDARAEYFQNYHRVNDHKRRQLELKFFKAVEELREFEDGLTNEQVTILNEYKFKNYKPDVTYSSNHKVDQYDTYKGPIEDSMMLESQIKRPSFKDDTEESIGSIEDYKKYKGL